MTRRSNVSTAAYLLMVFLSGVVVGVFSYRLYMVSTVQSGSERQQTRTPEEYRKKVIQEMTARLKLNENQVVTLQQIMDETRQRYHDVRERQKPELKAIEAAHYERVRAMLSDAQRTEYEKMRAERERRRAEEAEKKRREQQR